ncbi:hypothetical protein TSOC_001030 [Tetrabaena socialis]|uniref:Uncharacterized protein n=1 Tax=Tetrabaena socialis TaxID=47790 RepID=A0A2J8AHX0_9CHLO|nr:hypothetical protein TSOC_001030 [Tetrabaena socialis]|eukprot:PNH12119.1 hypothetical protein TSOC_001030 [Tetrabaena socialis]
MLLSARAAPIPGRRPSRVVVARASAPHYQQFSVGLAASLGVALVLVAPSLAIDPDSKQAPPPPAGAATAISFTRVDAKVVEKIRARDEMMAWKCQGTMYDCDGELAAAAEKRFEEMSSKFKTEEE